MADENRFTVVAEWLNDWLALNGTVIENDPEKLSKFMREFGEQVIDKAGYYNHSGANLIPYLDRGNQNGGAAGLLCNLRSGRWPRV